MKLSGEKMNKEKKKNKEKHLPRLANKEKKNLVWKGREVMTKKEFEDKLEKMHNTKLP